VLQGTTQAVIPAVVPVVSPPPEAPAVSTAHHKVSPAAVLLADREVDFQMAADGEDIVNLHPAKRRPGLHHFPIFSPGLVLDLLIIIYRLAVAVALALGVVCARAQEGRRPNLRGDFRCPRHAGRFEAL